MCTALPTHLRVQSTIYAHTHKLTTVVVISQCCILPLSMMMGVPLPLCVEVYCWVRYRSGGVSCSEKWYSCGFPASAGGMVRIN